ncbi:MAG: galactokinase family protein [Gemmatimonadota bacterium]
MLTAPFAGMVRTARLADEVPRVRTAIARCEELLPRNGSHRHIRGFVPGRVELLGKHVDYAGGRSLVCAIDRGIAFAAQPRRDSVVRVTDAHTGSVRESTLHAAATAEPGDWGVYVAAVARRIARDTGARRGVDIVFASDLPRASGLSSSTALLITAFLPLAQCNDWFRGDTLGAALRTSPIAVADYAAAVESGRAFDAFPGDPGVGTLGGSQDHVAILCANPGALSRFAFLPTRHLGDIAFPGGMALAVAFSGVHAPKAGHVRHAYNRASRAVTDILAILNANDGHTSHSLAEAVDRLGVASIANAISNPQSLAFSPSELLRRLKQFTIELEVHDAAVSALSANDLQHFAQQVRRSQRAAEDLLANQIPETVALVRLALDNGASAASAFGAGFGGSVWALVAEERAARFIEAWRSVYLDQHEAVREHAEFFVARPSAAARFVT